MVEVIRDVRHGKSRVFEQSRRAHEVRKHEVPPWRRQARAEETTHQRARDDAEHSRQGADGAYAGVPIEQHAREALEIFGSVGKIIEQVLQCLAIAFAQYVR